MNKEKTNSSILDYAIALILILDCRSIWAHRAYATYQFTNVLYLLLSICVIVYIFFKVRYLSPQKVAGVIVPTLIAVFFLFFYLIVNSNNNYKSLTKLMLLTVILIIYYYSRDDLSTIPNVLYSFEDILLVIAVISLSLWLFGSVFGLIHSTGEFITTWTGTSGVLRAPSYYGVYFNTQSYRIFGNHIIPRNTAIFTEAPMSSYSFSLALLIEMFLNERRKRRIIIFIVATLSTFSATGYLACALCIMFSLLYSEKMSVFNSSTKAFIITIVVVFFALLLCFIVLTKVRIGVDRRAAEILSGIDAWMQHPILGNGYGNGGVLIKSLSSSLRGDNRGYSNSVFQVLGYGGIYLLLPYVICAYRGIHFSKNNHQLRSFVIVFLFMISITVVEFQAITIFILIWIFNFDQIKIQEDTLYSIVYQAMD